MVVLRHQVPTLVVFWGSPYYEENKISQAGVGTYTLTQPFQCRQQVGRYIITKLRSTHRFASLAVLKRSQKTRNLQVARYNQYKKLMIFSDLWQFFAQESIILLILLSLRLDGAACCEKYPLPILQVPTYIGCRLLHNCVYLAERWSSESKSSDLTVGGGFQQVGKVPGEPSRRESSSHSCLFFI